MNWHELLPMDWRALLEVFVLWCCIYNAWRSIRGTRGAKVLTGLACLAGKVPSDTVIVMTGSARISIA